MPLQIPNGLSFKASANELIKNYDVVFAADTNTKTSANTVSICCALRGVVVKSSAEYGLDLYYGSCFVFEGVIDKPENSAWCRVIQFMKESYPDKYMSMKFGLVVDSDLGNMKEYNSREKPFFENFTLPPNVEFIYASSDAGKENIFNKMISLADGISNQMFKHLESGGNIETFEPSI